MGPRVHIHLDFETRLPPARVIETLTDFSEDRLAMWPNIDPAKYAVHEVGDGWAVVTEGNREPDIWARERYDWDAGHVSIKAEESNFCVPGDGTDIRVAPAPAGGSRIVLDWEREAASPAFAPLMEWLRANGEGALLEGYRGAWDALADREAVGAESPDDGRETPPPRGDA